MNEKKAIEIMTNWLSHKNELGKKPIQIKAAGSFSYDDNTYVILKFKPSIFDKWQVGVCGFDEEGEECGHTFSEYEEYDETTAKEKCIAMIEYLKEYWKSRFQAELERRGIDEQEYWSMTDEERKKRWEETEKQDAGQVGFVLLRNADIDFTALSEALLKAFEVNEEEDSKCENNILVFDAGSNLISVSLMDTPVPNGEAEYFAEGNFLWKEAVETTKQHQAHLTVAVINRDGNPIEAACFFADAVNLCAGETGALGIYVTGTVHEPRFYDEWVKRMHDGSMPLPIWVYVGLIKGENGNCGYTYGLTKFGRPELEVIDSSHSMEEIYEFLYNTCEGLLSANMYLRDGETLSFTSDQRLTITKSKAVYVDGDSFKIGY